jgi:hypothetical protein
MTNTMAVTSAHCFGGTDPSSFAVQMGSQSTTISRVWMHPNLDVAAFRLANAFIAPDPNAPAALPFSDHGWHRKVYTGQPIGSTTSTDGRGVPFQNPIYLEGGWHTLQCYGYGDSTVNGKGSGTLRTAKLVVPGCYDGRGMQVQCSVPRSPNSSDRGWPPSIYYDIPLEPNPSSQQIRYGDSGGPCLYGDQIVSVNWYLDHDSSTDLGTAHVLNAWSWGSWLQSLL